MFFFNPELLLINVGGFAHGAHVILTATIGMLAFVSGTTGYLLRRSTWYERAALIVAVYLLQRFGRKPGAASPAVSPPRS